jgi:hypothetical protein
MSSVSRRPGSSKTRQPMPTMMGLKARLARCRRDQRLEALGTLWLWVADNPDLHSEERETLLAYLRQQSDNECVPDEPRWRGNREPSERRSQPAASPIRRAWYLDALSREFVLFHTAYTGDTTTQWAYVAFYGRGMGVNPRTRRTFPIAFGQTVRFAKGYDGVCGEG